MKPFERATLPNQYDLDDLNWEKIGRSESVRTGFFWEYLEPYSHDWKDKEVLDIGAGTGWLLVRALASGAKSAVGIEPSEKNIAQGAKDHPEITLVKSTLGDYEGAGQSFDVAVAVMSFPHIENIAEAFQKLAALIKRDGELIVIIPDYDYFKLQRHGYAAEVQPIDDDQYAIATTRPSGVLADIVRKTQLYQHAAESAGFELVEAKEMKPTQNQIAQAPQYEAVKDIPLTHLLRFKIKK